MCCVTFNRSRMGSTNYETITERVEKPDGNKQGLIRSSGKCVRCVSWETLELPRFQVPVFWARLGLRIQRQDCGQDTLTLLARECSMFGVSLCNQSLTQPLREGLRDVRHYRARCKRGQLSSSMIRQGWTRVLAIIMLMSSWEAWASGTRATKQIVD